MAEHGIQETLDVVNFGASLGQVVKAAKEDDGKIDAADSAKLLSLIPYVGPALAGLGGVPAELKDLDSVEADALAKAVAAIVGDVSSAKAGRIATKAAALAGPLFELIEEIGSDEEPVAAELD